MNINEKKEKLLNNEISVSDLTSEEVEEIKIEVKKELEQKKEDLKSLNKNIKTMKKKIDNWAN